MFKELDQNLAFRYSRQILLPGFDLDKQETLINCSVLQIGAGGLGCASAQYLVASGVGKITLVDDDQVELTNLQRQILHSESDIGSNKVKSAKNALTKLNSHCEIDIIDHRLDMQELLKQIEQHDVVLDCSDNLQTRNQINQACYQNDTPLVSGAAIRMEGQVASFIPNSGKACYRCLSHMFGEQTLTCVESGIMSPVVGIIGSMQALEAIKILTNFGQPLNGKLLIFDAMTSQWRDFVIPKHSSCEICAGK